MGSLLRLVLVTVSCWCLVQANDQQWMDMMNSVAAGIDEDMNAIENSLYSTARQLMMQQYFTQERVRSEGSSGLKQVRSHSGGSENYFTGTHTSHSIASIHDHANNIRTVGMGELIAVLNGFEFRTRHNDYRLYKPSANSGDYEAVDEIDFPPIPPEVSSKPTIEDQAAEMREWFKAWRDQDDSIRNYKQYFKPVLCYLEGAWIIPDENIEESFHSDRHFLDAHSWFNLMEKVKFTSDTGSKSRFENLAFLPTKVSHFVNGTVPVFAQWNYRILCHPLNDDLPTNRFHLKDELSSRLRHKRTIHQHLYSRAARFSLNPEDKDELHEKPVEHEFLDTLMEQIPGKDNYGGYLNGEGIDGEEILNMDGTTRKDVSRYHRFFRISKKDAMGLSTIRRAYSDNAVFVAHTTQPKVAPSTLTRCNRWNKNGCTTKQVRVSYAIPMEIIYLTPLNSWNPYNLVYKGEASSDLGQTVIANGRNGACNKPGEELDGINSRAYYATPSVFYGGSSEVGRNAADTVRGEVCVNKDGVLHRVKASGVRVFFPPIPGSGILRQRYPIMPIHGEGSSVWKELRALERYVMDSNKFSNYAHKDTSMQSLAEHSDVTYRMGDSEAGEIKHTHFITLSAYEIQQLKAKKELTVSTTTNEGHDHILFIIMDDNGDLRYLYCEKRDWTCCSLCPDKHKKKFTLVGS